MPSIDERLMAASEADRQRQEEMSYSDQLRQKKMAGADSERQAEAEPRSLRQRVQTARQAMDLKQRAKDKIEEKALAPAKQATNRALQWAWKSLIPSWGLSSIWINIHVFLKGVFGEKLFCKLGEEWIPKQIAGAGGEAGKTVSKSLGLVEIMVLAFIDIVIFFVIVGFFAMFTDESTFKTMTGESNKNQSAATQTIK